MHPPIGRLAVRVSLRPPLDGIADFSVIDEGYAHLRRGDVEEIAHHSHDEVSHPVVWLAGDRVAYDALGHDVRSFRSEPHRRVIGRLAHWLTRP